MSPASPLYRWNILLLLPLSQAIAYADRVNLAVVTPTLIEDYGYTAAGAGLLQSIFNAAFTLSLLLAGPFTDRVLPRVSYPLGVALWSAATALCSTTQSFVPLAAFLILLGIGESVMIPSGARIIRQTFGPEHRAKVVSIFFAGNKIGLSAGNFLASLLLFHLGWGPVFYVTGAIGFLWIGWWLYVYREPQAHPPMPAPAPKAQSIRWLDLLGYRSTWGVILGQAGYLYIYYVFVTWLPGYLVRERGLSILATGVVAMLPFLLGILSTIGAGWAGDAMIAAGARVTAVRKGFAVGGLLGATVFMVAGAYAADTTLAVILLTLSVVSLSCSTAHVNAMPIDIAPPHIVSSLVSLQNFGGNVGGTFAPFLTGLLVTATGSFRPPLLLAAAIALIFGCGAYGFIVGNLDKELGK